MSTNHIIRTLRPGRTLASLVCAGLFIGCSALHSALTVPPGLQFELGGNQHGAFTINARNVGDVAVTLIERRSDGQLRSLGTCQPGQQQTLRFTNRSTAIVDNTLSQKPARLDLVVTGDTNLSMKNQKP